MELTRKTRNGTRYKVFAIVRQSDIKTQHSDTDSVFSFPDNVLTLFDHRPPTLAQHTDIYSYWYNKYAK